MEQEFDGAQMVAFGFQILLTVIFLFLKLFGAIGWSWWWVFSPLWLPVVIGLGVGIIAGIVIAVKKAVEMNS